jgi:branched-subunit amino acid aminotransferase/4-amino-4-deoxychorismate lyase
VTPPLAAGLLPGIAAFVLNWRMIDLPAREERLTPDDVSSADEAFITGTTREVTPVVRVDEHAIGTGRPGPIAQALLARFRARALEPTVR